MTEESYRKRIRNLIFDEPRPGCRGWRDWKVPDRGTDESFELHLQRLRRYKQCYFERVRKLEHGGRLSWL